MATLGSTGKPTTFQVFTGLNTGTQVANRYTMPTSGKITHVGVWAAGSGGSATAYNCIWDSSGNLLAQSASYTMASKSFALGNSDQYYKALVTPYEAPAGKVLYIGFSRDPAETVQWGTTGSGTHYRDNNTGSFPDDASFGSNSGSMGAYATYSTNVLPNAPSITSPKGGAILTDLTPNLKFTHSDPDGDTLLSGNGYDIQVDSTSDFSSPLWAIDHQLTGASGNTVTRTYAGSALSRGTTYYWRARTSDNVGYGPWSATASFRVNRLPTATKTSPTSAALATIWNIDSDTQAWTLAGAFPKPKFTWTFSDGDNHAQSAYRVRVYSASVGGSLLYDTGKVTSSTKSHSSSWAGVHDTEYWWTIEVWDSLGETSSESSRTAFKMLFAQAIYEHAVTGGTSSSAWKFTNGTVATGTQAGFLFASATGAGGAGRSAWTTKIGAVSPNAYLNVLVRLATSTSGTSPALPDMQFEYVSSGVLPEKWQTSGGGAGAFLLDDDIRRFGTRSLKITGTSGSSISVPGTASLQGVKTSYDDGAGSLTATLPSTRQAGDLMVLVLSHDAKSNATTDTNTPSGWTRIRRDMLSNGDVAGILFYRVATGDESAPTLTLTNGPHSFTDMTATILLYRHGQAGTWTIVGSGVTQTADTAYYTSHTAPSIASGTPDDEFITVWHKAANTTTYSGYSGALSEVADPTFRVFGGHAIATETLTASAATGTRTATSSIANCRLEQSLVIRPDDTTQLVAGDHLVYQTGIPVSPSTTYTLSGWIKTNGSLQGGSVRFEAYKSGTTDLIASSDSITDTSASPDGWQRNHVTFTTPTDTTALEVRIVYADPTQDVSFWVDAMQLEEGEIVSSWKPGAIGPSAVIDVGGISVDGTNGGIFRLKASDGTAVDLDDIVKVGPLDTYTSGVAGNVLAGTSAMTAITGASITVDLVAGRRYFIYAEVYLQPTVGTDRISIEIHRSGGQIQSDRRVPNETNPSKFICSAFYDPESSGSETFTVKAGRNSGTGTITVVQGSANPTIFYVMDVGPA